MSTQSEPRPPVVTDPHRAPPVGHRVYKDLGTFKPKPHGTGTHRVILGSSGMDFLKHQDLSKKPVAEGEQSNMPINYPK